MISRSRGMRLLMLGAGIALLTSITAKVAYSTFAANQSASQLKLKRVIMEGGWEVPGLEESEMVYSRKPVEFGGDKPIRLYITAFEPKRQIISSVPLYYSLSDNGTALVVKQQQVSILGISKLEFNNNAFCYAVYVQVVSYNKKTGVMGYSAKISLRYYDDDGDGTFESYNMGSENSLYPPKVPEWAQR